MQEPACCTRQNLHLWRWPHVAVTTAETPPAASQCSHPLFPEAFHKRRWMSMGAILFFHREWKRWHTFASCALSRQIPFCQTAPLLPPVPWHKHVMKYWWETSTSTAIALTSASDTVGKRNKTAGTAVRAALIQTFWFRLHKKFWMQFIDWSFTHWKVISQLWIRLWSYLKTRNYI